MKLKTVKTKKEFHAFYDIVSSIYGNCEFHRSTEDEIVKLLLQRKSSFRKHSTIIPYLITKDSEVVGRFALIQDHYLPEIVQVSFFEAQSGLNNVLDMIRTEIRAILPDCNMVVIGLNGHLNYGAGFLLNRFDEVPVFGLPYTHDYYNDYFKSATKNLMVSYRFGLEPFYNYHSCYTESIDFDGISVRKLDKSNLKKEIDIYTTLNNLCFQDHPYWAKRQPEEDFELFYPFRFFIKEENLLFAEKNGKPIGFLLWYPDFNQLVKSNTNLGLSSLIRYKLGGSINTFRFTEIAVLPEYRNSKATLAMILHTIPFLKKRKFQYGEGGFIFQENNQSIAMTERFLKRATGNTYTPYRQYAVYNCSL